MQVHDDTTELEAFNIAMRLEWRSHRFFRDFAEQLSDSSSRKVFMEIVREEQSHIKMLLKEYKAVSEGR